MNIIEKLQAIYNNEFNISIGWFWDGGVDVKIGDDTNGIRAEANFDSVAEAVDWAYEQTIGKRK